MSEVKVMNFKRQVIGYIDTRPDGTKIAKDFYRRKLGEYSPRSDVTKDFYGHIVAHGDQTAMLINMQYAETHKTN